MTKSTDFDADPLHHFKSEVCSQIQAQLWHKSNQTKHRLFFFFFPTTDQGSSDLHSSRREAPRTNAQGVSILLFLKNLNYYISKGHVTRKCLGSYIFLIIPPALK